MTNINTKGQSRFPFSHLNQLADRWSSQDIDFTILECISTATDFAAKLVDKSEPLKTFVTEMKR